MQSEMEATSIEVSEHVRARTRRCGHNFSCLETRKCGERDMCEVEHSIGSVLLLKTGEPAVCNYRVNFGERQVCTCPIHCEIHAQERNRR